MYNINKIRDDFPFLEQKINNKSIIYFDTSASAQKPKIVIDSITRAYKYDYANVHRGLYYLSHKASEKYENVRKIVQKFLNSKFSNEIVITKGTTEAINIVAKGIVKNIIKSNDEIIVTEMEHHANFVPWQMLCKDKNLSFKIANIKNNGELDIINLLSLVTNKTKILAITLCSNILGTINPIKHIIKLVKEINPNIFVLVDGAQAVMHIKVDVQDLGCDFFVFSGHKLYGPTGIGILYGKYEILKQLSPYNYGGGMIEEVNISKTTFALPPYRFEAGTPNIVGAIGLTSAIKYISSIGITSIAEYEQKLLKYATDKFNKIIGLKIIGQAKYKAAILTFNINGYNASDIGELLSIKGICVRTGKHCAHPLMIKLGINSSVRVSFGMYNTFREIDLFLISLKKVISQLKYFSNGN